MPSKKLREQAEVVFSAYVEKRGVDETSGFWLEHSRGAARMAEIVAGRAGMDADLAYAAGLIHDIGRYEGAGTGMYHVLKGYNILNEEGLADLSHFCLTHSFNPKAKVHEMQIGTDEEYDFVRDFIYAHEYDDYDKLVQLADFMSGGHGVTTVERRFCSVLARHGLRDARGDLLALLELKRYFDHKCGVNIYELFTEEIAQTSLRGVMDDGSNKQKLVEEEND